MSYGKFVDGVWASVIEAYKKVNSVWVKQSDLTAVFQNGINYAKGVV